MDGDLGELGRQSTTDFCCEQKEEIEKREENSNWSNRDKRSSCGYMERRNVKYNLK